MRLYYGTYGHHLSGKLYVYWGDDNLRTGQHVVAPVTNPKSGKNYKTMFTIARTQTPQKAQDEVDRLGEMGIVIKTISGREVLSLPGAKPFKSAAEWERDSDRRYRARFNLPEPPKETSSKTTSQKSPQTSKQSTRSSKGKVKRKKNKNAIKKAIKKTVKKAVNTTVRVLNRAVREIDAKETKARLNVRTSRTAADSFRAKDRLKQIKQREAFIEE